MGRVLEKKILGDGITPMMRSNWIALRAHWASAGVMSLFIVLQVIIGTRGAAYTVLMLILGLVPPVIETVIWKKNRESVVIKYLAAWSFMLFYLVGLFTALHGTIYVFAIPMIMVLAAYNDVVFSIQINAVATLASIVVVVLGAQTGGFGYSGIDAAVTEITVMILVGIFSSSASKTIRSNISQQMEKATNAKRQAEDSLVQVSSLSESMQSGIREINQDIENLNTASLRTQRAMSEVSEGSKDTADAVQEQLLQTEAIQNKVASVDEATDQITDSMEATLSVLEESKRYMEELVGQVDNSVSNSEDVSKKLENLDIYMNKMYSIIEMINAITNQTSMLALNASIEAARAGEAGKGFAVVATEINGMASKTKEATLNISNLISDVSTAIGEVVEVIGQMIKGIKEEKEGAGNVNERFQQIMENTMSVKDNLQSLSSSVDELREANEGISNSIQTISAVTEQVTAHANETMEAEENNAEILQKIVLKMDDLMGQIN